MNETMRIANPTYDFTFNGLFGAHAPDEATNGGKSRLISFLNSIYNDNITDNEYIDSTNEIYDIACKCYDQYKHIFDIEIQRKDDPYFIDQIIMHATRLLVDSFEYRNNNYFDMPSIRVLYNVNHIFDE